MLELVAHGNEQASSNLRHLSQVKLCAAENMDRKSPSTFQDVAQTVVLGCPFKGFLHNCLS